MKSGFRDIRRSKGGQRRYKGAEETSGSKTFITLIAAIVSWVYTHMSKLKVYSLDDMVHFV